VQSLIICVFGSTLQTLGDDYLRVGRASALFGAFRNETRRLPIQGYASRNDGTGPQKRPQSLRGYFYTHGGDFNS
jgi:hypothetical protein